MNRCRLAMLVAAALVCGQGFALAQGSPQSRGEALVSQHCAMCHAIGRSDTSPNAMARSFRTLGRTYPIETLEQQLSNSSLLGHPMMPRFTLTPREARAIVRYLQSIQEQ